MIRLVLALGLALAGCDSTPCEDATLLTACPECGPGEVRAGISTTSGGRAIARPGGGIARIGCDTHLVRHDPAFAVADDVGLYAEGSPALWSITAAELVALTAAGDAAIAYGWTEEAVTFGDFTVQGLFAVGLGALDGQPRWA